MTERSIIYRMRISGGDQARAEVTRFADTQEAQDKRLIASAEARQRRAAEAERTLAKLREDAAKAQARADAVAGPGGFSAFQQREREAARAVQLAKEEAKAKADLTARADRLLSAIDPLHAAQQRYNNGMAEANALYRAGAISADQLTMAHRRQKQALDAATQSGARHGATLGQQRAAYLQLGYQIQDITQGIAAGTPPMVILAQQAGQTASAVGLATGGAAGRKGLLGALAATAGFMSGPWGAAILGGAMILGTLYAANRKAGDAEDERTKGLKSLADAQENLDRVTGRLIKTEEQQVSANMNLIATERQRAIEIRKTTLAMLEKVDALATDKNPVPSLVGFDQGTLAVAEATRLRAEIARLKTQIDEGEARQRAGSAFLIRKQAERDAGKGAAEAERHRAALKALEAQFTKTGNEQSYRRALLAEYDLHEKNSQAARAHGKAVRESTRDLLTLKEAQSMVLDAVPGARITSTTGGKHAKDSYHYKGQAIDFVPAGGMGSISKEELRRRLEAQGMQIKELLGPGDPDHDDHFHVAWTGGKGAASAVSGMERMAEELDQLKARFDPVHAAMMAYKRDLEDIARLQQAGLMDPIDAANAQMKAANDLGAARSKAFYASLGIDVQGEFEQQRDAANDNASARRDAMREIDADLREGNEHLKFQLSIMKLSDGERRRAVALHERVLQLQRDGVELSEDEIAALKQKTDGWVQLSEEVERAQAVQDEFRRIGESTLDSIFDPANLKDWGGLWKRILQDIQADMIKLALLNPLKNALYGGSLPTLGGLFGGGKSKGILPGDDPVGRDKVLGGLGFLIPRNALGTARFGGGLTWVGENGPELAALPAGTRITPAASARALAAGNDNRSMINVEQHLHFAGGVDLASRQHVEQMGEAVFSATMAALHEQKRRAA